MKLTLLLSMVAIIQLWATETYSQLTHITLKLDDVTISEALKEIENQSEFFFLYSPKLIDVERKVNIDAKDETIKDILAGIFDEKVKFAAFDRQVVLTPNERSGVLSVLPQQNKITGTVTDKNGPIPGANVVVTGTTQGVITDSDGKYSIEVPQGSKSLKFSFIGMESQEINIGTLTQINVTMTEAAIGLEEVVVIGYGTQTKRDISGSITNVKEKDFNQGVNKSALDLIQGKVAGLSVVTSSSDVTSTGRVFLRGISSLSGSVSPFYVIDGVPGMDVNSVATQDIESITILKDASATAIYGSRAASGVIMITTKKGKSEKTLIEYSSKVLVGSPASKPPLLSASEYRAYAQKSGIDISSLDQGANTDWFKEVTNKNSISHEQYISASGGSEKSNYRASFNYLNNQGIIKENFMERFNSYLTLNQKAMKDKLNVSFIAGAVKSNERGIDFYSQYMSGINTMNPTRPVKNPDGTWNEVFNASSGNIVHSTEANKALKRGYSVFINSKVDLEIFKGFFAGWNLYTGRGGNEYARYYAKTTSEGYTDNGSASRSNYMDDRNLLELTLKYLKKIKLHSIELLSGYSYEKFQSRDFIATARGFITDEFGFDNLSAADVSKYIAGDISSSGSMNTLIGFFGRLNYSFNERYILSATLRHDGSSKFGANNKWGNFPSISVAWRIVDEPFMDSFGFLNDLKLRLGYGVAGNQAGISPYKSIALYSTGPLYYNNGKWENTYQYSQNPNPNLKWEQTATFNAGLDFSLYNDRIQGSIDYYTRLTSNLLYTYNVPVPPYLFGNILTNVGNISNKGIEFVINGDIIRNQDFRWNVSFNIAHNKQLVTKISNDLYQVQQSYVGQVYGRGQGAPTHILKEGEEVSTFYGPVCLGLDEDGMFIIKDVNKDGIIDSEDKDIIGHGLPRATYGITNTTSYKRFDFSFFLRGVYGNDVFNNDRLLWANPTNFPVQSHTEVLTSPLRDKMQYSSYYMEKGSFLRLQNASLGYNFNTKKLGINKLKVYIAGENLFVITKYSGIDPELAAQNSSDLLAQGTDPGGLPPLIRRFIFGINIAF